MNDKEGWIVDKDEGRRHIPTPRTVGGHLPGTEQAWKKKVPREVKLWSPQRLGPWNLSALPAAQLPARSAHPALPAKIGHVLSGLIDYATERRWLKRLIRVVVLRKSRLASLKSNYIKKGLQ